MERVIVRFIGGPHDGEVHVFPEGLKASNVSFDGPRPPGLYTFDGQVDPDGTRVYRWEPERGEAEK